MLEKESENIYVFYESNDFYAPMTGISIMSMIERHLMSGIIHFVIVCDEVSDKNIQRLQHIVSYPHTIKFIDAKPYVTILDNIDSNLQYFGAYTTNLHFFVQRYFSNNIQKCIFIDGDTLFEDDIEKVWKEIQLNEKSLGMSIDCISQRYKKVIGLNKKQNYFSTGFIIYNLDKWRKNNCEARLLEHINKHKINYAFSEQDVYNVVLNDEIKKISIKYNLLSSWLLYEFKFINKVYGINKEMLSFEEYSNAIANPFCYHFAGNTFGRPWFKKCIHPAIHEYLLYFNKSEWKNDNTWFVKNTPVLYKIWNILYLYFPKKIFGIIASIAQNLFMFYTYDIKNIWRKK